MSRRVPRHDLAWMAAIIEIRGRIRRYETAARATPQLSLRVHSRQLNLMDRLGELTGVQVRNNEAVQIAEPGQRRGCLEHCPQPHVHTAVEIPSIGVWAVVGIAAAVVLHNLMPYLTEDSTKIQAFVDEAIENLPRGRGRHAAEQSVRRLIKLGWEIPAEVDVWLKEGT